MNQGVQLHARTRRSPNEQCPAQRSWIQGELHLAMTRMSLKYSHPELTVKIPVEPYPEGTKRSLNGSIAAQKVKILKL